MDTITIDDKTFQLRRNVKSYSVNIHSSEYVLEYSSGAEDCKCDDSSTPTYILIFETKFHAAFSHWVYESAVFLRYHNKFEKELGANVKIHYTPDPQRGYKKLFFEMYGIPTEKLITELTPTNISIICPVATLNNKRYDMKVFRDMVVAFRQDMLGKLPSHPQYFTEDYLLLPRSQKENYSANDRTINYDHIISFLGARNKKLRIHDTIKTKSFAEQIHIIRSSRNIILDYGSSLWVNGLFANGSNIYVVGNLKQHRSYRLIRCLLQLIKETNKVRFLKNNMKVLL